MEVFTCPCTYFQRVCTHQQDALQLAWHVAFQQLQRGQRSTPGGRLDSPKMKETYGLNSLCLTKGWFTQAFMTNLLIFLVSTWSCTKVNYLRYTLTKLCFSLLKKKKSPDSSLRATQSQLCACAYVLWLSSVFRVGWGSSVVECMLEKHAWGPGLSPSTAKGRDKRKQGKEEGEEIGKARRREKCSGAPTVYSVQTGPLLN